MATTTIAVRFESSSGAGVATTPTSPSPSPAPSSGGSAIPLGSWIGWGVGAYGGMSGVVYALFGYLWMKGQVDPEPGMVLHPSTVRVMLLWLVLGWPWGVLVGIGAAVSTLSVTTPRNERTR